MLLVNKRVSELSLKPSKTVFCLGIISILLGLALSSGTIIRWFYSIENFNEELIEVNTGVDKTVMPKRFSLIVWNIYKAQLFPQHPLPFSPYDYDFALLQEDYFPLNEERHQSFKRKGWNYFWPAFKMKDSLYGTSIFSKIRPGQIKGYNSLDREPLVNTPKSFISIDLEDLRLLNIHALNFVGFEAWKKQIDHLLEQTQGKTYVIAAGDFNTSSKKRFDYLHLKMKENGLSEVVFNNDSRVVFEDYPVDYVFARGLTLKSAEVMNLPNFSDHNPMEVVFEIKEDPN